MKLKEAVIVLSVCIVIVLMLEIFTPINLVGRVIGYSGSSPSVMGHTSSEITFNGPYIYVASDNIGIGYSNPTAAKLVINSEHSQLMFRDQDTGEYTHFSYSSDVLAIRMNAVSGTPKFVITDAGDVGIGTQTPAAKLDIIQSGQDPAIMVSGGTNPWIKVSDGVTITKLQTIPRAGIVGTDTNDDFRIHTSNLPRVTVKNSGEVGIGTASPSEKLEVAGNVKAALFKGDLSGTASYATSAGTATSAGSVPWAGITSKPGLLKNCESNSATYTSGATDSGRGNTLSCPSGKKVIGIETACTNNQGIRKLSGIWTQTANVACMQNSFPDAILIICCEYS